MPKLAARMAPVSLPFARAPARGSGANAASKVWNVRLSRTSWWRTFRPLALEQREARACTADVTCHDQGLMGASVVDAPLGREQDHRRDAERDADEAPRR